MGYKKDFKVMMGCYGIGISRLIAAYIEQNNDEKGIIWSNVIYPFKIIIIPINYDDKLVKTITNLNNISDEYEHKIVIECRFKS